MLCHEYYHILRYDAVYSVEFQPIFRRNISPPSSGFKKYVSSTLKTETIFSSEMSVETQRTTRRHIPEDDTLHNHRCEKLKSYTICCVMSERFLKFIGLTVSSTSMYIYVYKTVD
jgi:hypothetical protein